MSFKCKMQVINEAKNDERVKSVPKIMVRVDVELHEGHLTEISYPALTNNGWGKWEDLVGVEYEDEYRLMLPHAQFAYEAKVNDVVCGRWNDGDPKWEDPLLPHPDLRPSPIIVTLESPHDHEYNYVNGRLEPLEPLMTPGSRTRLRNQFARLVNAIQENIDLHHDPQIVLCNPIQFQTSLHGLIQPNPQGKRGRLRQAIRNATWRGLWQHPEGNSLPFQQNFIDRLIEREPCMIINACTRVLQDELAELFIQLPYPVFNATNHPARWDVRTQILEHQNHR